MDGNPQIILFDIGSAAWKMDEYKQELWDSCHFGIPHLDIEANDAVIFGYLMCQFISEFRYKKSSCYSRLLVCMCVFGLVKKFGSIGSRIVDNGGDHLLDEQFASIARNKAKFDCKIEPNLLTDPITRIFLEFAFRH